MEKGPGTGELRKSCGLDFISFAVIMADSFCEVCLLRQLIIQDTQSFFKLARSKEQGAVTQAINS